MGMRDYINEVFNIASKEEFNTLALKAFEIQKKQCPVYSEYLKLIDKENFCPSCPSEIPFLPIKLFKTRKIVTAQNETERTMHNARAHTSSDEVVFTSSATTGMVPSKHYVTDISVYEQSFFKGFEHFYGSIKNYNLLALLPSYLERKGASLVYMAEGLISKIKESGGEGGFYLYDNENLLKTLTRLCTTTEERSKANSSNTCSNSNSNNSSNTCSSNGRTTVLLGVSFALLDFVKYLKTNNIRPSFQNLIIMETGGMKGRGKELTRNELHTALAEGFNLPPEKIHSEYGMAELLSQAYSTGGNGMFSTPPWMKVYIRDIYDPFKIIEGESSGCSNATCNGAINIIDLANINSCCFIETEDRGSTATLSGRKYFTIEGRLKDSELRGCNFLLGGS